MNSIRKRLEFLLLYNLSFYLTVTCKNQRVVYTGYEAHRFVPTTDEQVQILKDLEAQNPGVMFLKSPGNKGQSADVLFPPHLQFDVLQGLTEQIPNSLISNDIESMMDHDSHVALLDTMSADDFPFNVFWDFNKLTAFCNKMAQDHADIVTMEHYGKTVEFRDQFAMVISNKQLANITNPPVMVIEAGTHAREWVGMMAACVNPDGFVYSWKTDRLWRKNRSINKGNKAATCRGVDPNRNYDFGFGGEGTSSDPCSEIYCGTNAFSIPETKNLKDFFIGKNIVSYCSLHSYSQLVLLSFGCPSVGTTYPEFDSDIRIAEKATTALKDVHGTEYKSGNSNKILYAACGTCTDYFKQQGSRYAWTYELRDTGNNGFLIPTNQIEPLCEETTASLQSLHTSMANELMQAK